MNQESAQVITVDGPGGAGKGTVTQMLARQLGWHLLDSGALYRLTALAATRQGVAFDDPPGLARVALGLAVRFLPGVVGEPVRVELAGDDVTSLIRTESCGNQASIVAAVPAVRDALLQRQRDFQQTPGLVADGRDMGTVVFPASRCKIFLTASAEERASRRQRQLLQQGINASIDDLLREIRERDERDMNRATAPLKPAEDALTLDTTGLTIQQVLDKILEIATQHGVIATRAGQ